MVMSLGYRPMYPLLPAHALRFHLSEARTVKIGVELTMLCGDEIVVGIGARRIPESEWLLLHESLACQRCVRSFEIHGGRNTDHAHHSDSRPDLPRDR